MGQAYLSVAMTRTAISTDVLRRNWLQRPAQTHVESERLARLINLSQRLQGPVQRKATDGRLSTLHVAGRRHG